MCCVLLLLLVSLVVLKLIFSKLQKSSVCYFNFSKWQYSQIPKQYAMHVSTNQQSMCLARFFFLADAKQNINTCSKHKSHLQCFKFPNFKIQQFKVYHFIIPTSSKLSNSKFNMLNFICCISEFQNCNFQYINIKN